MVDKFNLKQILIDNGIAEEVFIKGLPLNFEDAIHIIQIATDWLIKFNDTKDFYAALEAVHFIGLNYLDNIKGLEASKLFLAERERLNASETEYRTDIRFSLCDIDALYDYIKEELEPAQNYELIGYIWYYINCIDEEFWEADAIKYSVENFIKAKRYDLAKRVCEQTIDWMNYLVANGKRKEYNEYYFVAQQYLPLIEKHEQEDKN